MGRITIDHEEIRMWVQSNSGRPQIVDDMEAGMVKEGLRIDFPGKEDEVFLSREREGRDISWEQFFEIFDSRGLAFMYNETLDRLEPNMSYKFIPRTNIVSQVGKGR